MREQRDAPDRAAYEATGNPLHVWAAIGCYAVDEPLPDWIRRYLMDCTRELWRLALDQSTSPAAAAERTARALGLVSQGRNRFGEVRQRREDSFIATLHSLGAATALALADATGTNPDGDPESRVRHIRRRFAKYRRTLPKG